MRDVAGRGAEEVGDEVGHDGREVAWLRVAVYQMILFNWKEHPSSRIPNGKPRVVVMMALRSSSVFRAKYPSYAQRWQGNCLLGGAESCDAEIESSGRILLVSAFLLGRLSSPPVPAVTAPRQVNAGLGGVRPGFGARGRRSSNGKCFPSYAHTGGNVRGDDD
uniref:Uncharacterized protein n=1 Tax=Photinus pyralis TaxID=7054 RepID=A0A1Y1M942_PHOPY